MFKITSLYLGGLKAMHPIQGGLRMKTRTTAVENTAMLYPTMQCAWLDNCHFLTLYSKRLYTQNRFPSFLFFTVLWESCKTKSLRNTTTSLHKGMTSICDFGSCWQVWYAGQKLHSAHRSGCFGPGPAPQEVCGILLKRLGFLWLWRDHSFCE